MNGATETFPYFSGKTILFAHGFASSGQNGAVASLRKLLPEAEILAPDLPESPLAALQLLKDLAAERQPALVIGTSMGGMLAEQLVGVERILVNPAFEMAESLRKSNALGRHEYRSPREDGATDFLITKSTLEEFQRVSEGCFSVVDEAEQERVFGLFGKHDTLVHTQPLFERHYRQSISFDGEHFLNDHALLRAVLPVIQWVDERQNGRENPVLYVGAAALLDEHGTPRSTAQKAVEILSRTYQMFALCAPDEIPLLEPFGVPLWNRAVHVPKRSLLLGDYLLDTTEEENFLGTSLRFGKDPFKTWEDMLIYFSLLGGQ